MVLHNDFARRLAGAGFYGPFRVRAGDTVIEDRGGHPMVGVLPVVGPDCAREAAVIAAAALNRLCGFETAAVQTCPMAEAAE